MKTQLPLALLAACTLACPPGSAEEILGVDPGRDGGFYVAGFGGFTFTEEVETDVDFSVLGLTEPRLEPEGAALYGGSVGVALGRFRAEAEVSRYAADAPLAFHQGVVPGPDPEISYLNLMANVLYDQPVVGRLDAYVGGGIGVSIIELDLPGELTIATVDADDNVLSTSSTDGGTEVVLAGQVLAGLAYRLTDSVAVNLGYRGVLTDDVDVDAFQLDGSYRSSIEAGLRFTF